VITHDHVGRWAKLMATRDNLAGCAARCAKSLLNRNESREIAKAILHAIPMGEDVDEGEVVVDVVKAFILDNDPINSGGSSNNACDEVLRMDAVRRIELHAAAMKAKKE